MMPEVSIIVVNYNTRKLVEDCIESIKNNTRVPYEIIVVENSTQGGFTSATGDFVLIRNKENLGFAKGVNQGIKKAKTEYILLLNSDILIKKDSIESLLDFVRKTPDAGVVGAKLFNRDGSIQASCFNFPSIKNAILQYWFGKKGLFDKYAPKGKGPAAVDAVVGAAFLITPQALEKVGRLDERYFMYFEDIDYCRRVKAAGLKVYYLPEAGIIHYHGESGKTIKDESNQWKRLIPSSKIYHGVLKHYILTLVIWLGQKVQKALWTN